MCSNFSCKGDYGTLYTMLSRKLHSSKLLWTKAELESQASQVTGPLATSVLKTACLALFA